VPRTFGDFEISDTQLGRGGMASVYLGRQISLDVPRAIKILHPAFAQDTDFISRFEREARHGAAISHHPNVVGVVSYGNERGVYYIAMELVDGTDLKSVMDQHRSLPPEIALLLVEEVAKGLAAAHRVDIWHRDIKPSNVLLRRTGEVQVGDFGLARNNRDRERLSQAAQTLPGTVMGTLAYMSPEQHAGWDDTRIDHRTDIFSLGVMTYELLAGERPFQGDHAEIRRQVTEREPDPLIERCPLATPEVQRLVSRMLAKRREDRHPSMTEVLADVRQALKSLDPDEDVLKDRQEYLREFAADPAGFCRELQGRNVRKAIARGAALAGRQPPDREGAIEAYRRALLLDADNAAATLALAELGGEPTRGGTVLRTLPAAGRPGRGRPASAKRAAPSRRTILLATIPLLGIAAFAWTRLGPGERATDGLPEPAVAPAFEPEATGDPADAATTPAVPGEAGGAPDPAELAPGEDASRTVTPDRDAALPAAPPAVSPQVSEPAAGDAPADATITIRLSQAADIYVDGELYESGAQGRTSVLVSSGRPHTLELRSPLGTRTWPGITVEEFGNRDLGTIDLRSPPSESGE
jgi:hypothetical protein